MNGGRRRGSAVDAQVTRLAGNPERSRRGEYRLTKLVFATLEKRGLACVMV